MFTGMKLTNEELVLSYRNTRDEGYLAELMRQNKGLLYIADYLIAGYTRQIKIPYVSGVTVDTTQNDPFGSVDAQGQYHDPDTKVSTQAKITYIDGLKKGDLVAVQRLNDTNKFVILARVKEA